MAKFTYWSHGDAVQADFRNDETLSTADAQVIATLQTARALETISGELKNLMHFLANHSVDVSVSDTKAKK